MSHSHIPPLIPTWGISFAKNSLKWHKRRGQRRNGTRFSGDGWIQASGGPVGRTSWPGPGALFAPYPDSDFPKITHPLGAPSNPISWRWISPKSSPDLVDIHLIFYPWYPSLREKSPVFPLFSMASGRGGPNTIFHTQRERNSIATICNAVVLFPSHFLYIGRSGEIWLPLRYIGNNKVVRLNEMNLVITVTNKCNEWLRY